MRMHPLPAGQGGFNTRSRRDVGSQQLESASSEALNQCYQRGLPVRLFFCAAGSNPDLEKQEVLVYAGEYKVGKGWLVVVCGTGH